MTRPQDLDRHSAVLALALATWGGAVLLGAANGVFTRISPEAALALAVLAATFAPAAILLDAGMRDHLAQRSTRVLTLVFAAAAIASLALLGVSMRGPGLGVEALASPPFVLLVYFVGPVALGAAAALAARARTQLTRSAPARSPAARRDAPRASRTTARGAGAAGA